jgi:hypothetical protein
MVVRLGYDAKLLTLVCRSFATARDASAPALLAGGEAGPGARDEFVLAEGVAHGLVMPLISRERAPGISDMRTAT